MAEKKVTYLCIVRLLLNSTTVLQPDLLVHAIAMNADMTYLCIDES